MPAVVAAVSVREHVSADILMRLDERSITACRVWYIYSPINQYSNGCREVILRSVLVPTTHLA